MAGRSLLLRPDNGDNRALLREVMQRPDVGDATIQGAAVRVILKEGSGADALRALPGATLS